MAAIGRGRSLKNLRIRGRNDSGEENVPLDLTREPSDNLREILQNVAKLQGVSNMRKLGHLNNFTKVSNSNLYIIFLNSFFLVVLIGYYLTIISKKFLSIHFILVLSSAASHGFFQIFLNSKIYLN